MTKAADIDPAKKVHPWRLCQYGQCAEKPHDRSITPSRHHPDGKTIVHFYCKDIESGKGVLVPLEMQVIASEHFSHLAGPPKADDLGFKTDGNAYDPLIRGWTKYWNEVLKPAEALDPDLIKALIASESGFNTFSGIKGRRRSAKGLMQLIPGTTEVLRNEHGELKDHFVDIPKAALGDPNLNIAGGIRWLFRKHETATSKLGRAVTWDEAVADYKSYLKDINSHGMEIFRNYYRRLKT
jgi:Transglycosylase SLT domain